MTAQEQVALLDEIPARIADALSADERIAAVWLGGSLGRGEGDALSDIDLVIVCTPDRVEEVSAGLEDRLPIAGPMALVHEAPRNAPRGGRHLNVLYDVGPLPFYVDWNVWPGVAARPNDVSVLFERDPTPLAPTATFASMLDELPRGHSPEQTPEVLDHFRVFMTPILVKHAARGWFESVDRMLQYMRVGAGPAESLEDVIALAERILSDHGAAEDEAAITCIRRYLALVEDHRILPNL